MAARFRIACSVLALVTALGGCDVYDQPRWPLPERFEAETLDGRTLRAEDLRGKPWVIVLWVPG